MPERLLAVDEAKRAAELAIIGKEAHLYVARLNKGLYSTPEYARALQLGHSRIVNAQSVFTENKSVYFQLGAFGYEVDYYWQEHQMIGGLSSTERLTIVKYRPGGIDDNPRHRTPLAKLSLSADFTTSPENLTTYTQGWVGLTSQEKKEVEERGEQFNIGKGINREFAMFLI